MTVSDPHLFEGVVCITPALSNRLKFGLFNYAQMFLSLLYNPTKRFDLPFTTEMCTRDIGYQKMMDSDSREIRFATAHFLKNLLFAQIKVVILRKKIKSPILFLLAGNDLLVNSAFSRKIFESLSTQDKKLIEYPGMYHALNVDLERGKVFNDISNWIGSHLQQLH